jgi:hypothetical protein
MTSLEIKYQQYAWNAIDRKTTTEQHIIHTSGKSLNKYTTQIFQASNERLLYTKKYKTIWEAIEGHNDMIKEVKSNPNYIFK